ncbi:Fic family protein [Nakamurella endophytica]|uniref:Cell filamentation protein Fic n=1 Tax=Nakamurella endophytica TaxID=1748367 RepID=A0A917WMI7_9ACTN|nr:Fic/DOC family N-terminal domain-containing protein [Nakamurella endophytica]GGM14431.1 cell filamentation protein Fic [Nakamurella endophytica]
MDPQLFGEGTATGILVPITGTDPERGPWDHRAFLPDPLPDTAPDSLTGTTYRAVANARAALAALDSTARHLPNLRLLRRPTLRSEAQSTSALEGTCEPLERVLTAADDPAEPRMREVINYETMAEEAFEWAGQGRTLTVPALAELQLILVRGTALEKSTSGMVRPVQVVIGRRPGISDTEFPVRAARFVPPPPGVDLEARLRDLLTWIAESDVTMVDPVVAAAMAHYQFETLHPFHDGNGRIGRMLIVLHLLGMKTLHEPTLTVSPWFEARRDAYQDGLLRVSTHGDWNSWIHFFALGLESSANATQRRMLGLVDTQAELKERVRKSPLRADSAHSLVDLAVSRITFTVRQAAAELGVSYPRANKLVTALIGLDILSQLGDQPYNRRFFAPQVLRVLVDRAGD